MAMIGSILHCAFASLANAMKAIEIGIRSCLLNWYLAFKLVDFSRCLAKRRNREYAIIAPQHSRNSLLKLISNFIFPTEIILATLISQNL
jgi:hypothetical protein